ncbi:MAG: SCP2 sterol-binding domain-containing protein [Actinobacteria bacterium]|nr:SCP2 sterol-binding domain-containing protein [Actinomycetota bacterium]
MAVKFLSQEWAEQVKGALNADEAFREAAATSSAKLLQVIGTPQGETRYWITIEAGTIDMGVGDLDGPDATISESYETAVALARSELSAVTAFMIGKIKIQGNMGLLLGLQGALSRLPAAMATLDVDY